MSYFNNHAHTHYSNIRLLDCINRPKDLINKAIEMGLSGIAITDHEALSCHIEVNQYAKELRETNPDFTIALGNEIYLTETRDNGQKYYHFILIAKDEIGHKGLRELSSTAWLNSYFDRGMERVPLLKSELKEVMKRYKGHIIGTTACMGGELGSAIINMDNCERVNDTDNRILYHQQIIDFMEYCIDVFGSEDFYIECAPSNAQDQIIVNKRAYRIAQAFGLNMCIGTDAHYLTKEDRYVHKAYLNSKGGEREVDSFYEFARLMDEEEVRELLSLSFDSDVIDNIIKNSNEIKNKITFYSLERNQQIPQVEVNNYEPGDWSRVPGLIMDNFDFRWKTIQSLILSKEPQERYWVQECLESLWAKGLQENPDYWDRLEIEADVIKDIGNKLNDCLFAYFNTFKHYIDLFWECGSIVGPGRGSSTGFLSNYLLGITQLDPIRWDIKYWRFLNKERAELPDIDIDLAPSKRPAIFKAIREERGELGLVQVATFGTEGTKSAVLTACRGYRSKDYPEGIDVDIAQYMSSLIPSHRGFLWPLKDVVYGNEEQDRKPVQPFINEVNKYPGLLDIMVRIEGLINKRSSHASGVILYDNDPYKTAAFMKTPSGDIITQYDLHKAEAAGDTKYDFLVTEVSDKIIKCIELLQEDNIIDKDLTLREVYNQYLHPEILDTNNEQIWEHLAAGDILDVFQFNEGSGLAIAKKLRPSNPLEMTAANAMMRLMSEKGIESQQDRYARIQKDGIQVFDLEMKQRELPAEIIEKMHQHCDKYYGCCPIQEQMMEILMDVSHFTLAEANAARKVVAKKQMNKIPQLKQQVYDKMEVDSFADYIWEIAVAPQLGYAFSYNHSLPYSFVGIQTIYLATTFNPIYWNTACLIVNSGATDEDNGGQTDYAKIAKAIGEIRSKNIKVSLVDINNSDFGFKPDIKNNQILFGFKGMLNVGDDLIKTIIEKRPYVSMIDFYNRVSPNKQAMISLIKGGAFDTFDSRYKIMTEYIWLTCDKKKRLTLQNMAGLIKYNLLPETTEEQIMARRIYEFNRYLKAECKISAEEYKVDSRAMNFLYEIDVSHLVDDAMTLKAKEWDKQVYQKWMDVFRNWIAENKDEILDKLNTTIFMEDWNKYAKGNLSSWEMEALCFYYHEHELANANFYRYGLVDFAQLPEEPPVEKMLKRGEALIPIYKLNKICGTCIAKNKAKSLVYLLTDTGVVPVKFRQEYFSLFDKQISERREDGTKKVLEKSWFNRGNMILVQGIRRGDDFIPKKYSSSPGHQLYKIDSIDNQTGELTLRHDRLQGLVEEDE